MSHGRPGFIKKTLFKVNWLRIFRGTMNSSPCFYFGELLYLIDEVDTPDLSVNVLGHQWFWEYNYSDFNNIRYESYIVRDLRPSNIRLIEVDNRLVLPYNCLSRLLIRSSDVLHSWTIPSMGVKADAVPGRLNQLSITSWATGLFYGQCSEICGANHRFMPIVLEIISPKRFLSWVNLW